MSINLSYHIDQIHLSSLVFQPFNLEIENPSGDKRSLHLFVGHVMKRNVKFYFI